MSLLPTQAEGRDYRDRYVWVLAVAFGALAILAVRLYWLQVARGDYYAERSRSNFVKRHDIEADRGMILDRRGTILVDARPSYDVELTPAFCPDVQGTLDRLAGPLGLADEALAEVRARLKGVRGLERFRAVLVRRDVSRDALDWIETHRLELDGVDVEVRPQRNYRFGPVLAHVLGYMNEVSRQELERSQAEGGDYELGDMIGRGGLEARFEKELRGQDGVEQVVVDAKGRRIESAQDDAGEPLIPESERVRPSVPGHNLVLSIDARLQEVAERSFPAKEGAVVVLDPQTGYVLAMVSRPSFDPNRMSGRITGKEMKALIDDPYQPLLHRAIQQHYPPGSTFKPVVALAALSHGTVRPEQGTVCNGGYRLGRRRWRCWRAAGHGFMDMEHALQHSCDTYFYWLGDQMGLNPIAETARLLGFGSPTGIGLPHEVPGIMPDEAFLDRVHAEGYQRGSALNAAIGQGAVTVTPIQLASAYAAIGNGGTVYVPQLVRRIEDADGRVLQEFLPEVKSRLEAPPEEFDAVVEGLRRVVNERGGTAYWRRPRDLDVEIAGKTGTAQVVRMGATRVDTNDLEYERKDHAWFAAFAPVKNPEIAVAVINEHGGHGGSAAAPTAFAVIEAYFRYKKEDEAARALRRPDPVPDAPAPEETGRAPRPPRPALPLHEGPRHAGEALPVAPGFHPPPVGVNRG